MTIEPKEMSDEDARWVEHVAAFYVSLRFPSAIGEHLRSLLADRAYRVREVERLDAEVRRTQASWADDLSAAKERRDDLAAKLEAAMAREARLVEALVKLQSAATLHAVLIGGDCDKDADPELHAAVRAAMLALGDADTAADWLAEHDAGVVKATVKRCADWFRHAAFKAELHIHMWGKWNADAMEREIGGK